MAITLNSFMNALSGQESGGDYNARNADSGAYGKFQIMPANWPSWSAEAGIPGAAQTPENQEKVARYKIKQYYDTYGNWEDVASVWYSGRPLSDVDPDRSQGNYPTIRGYVNSIIEKAGGFTPVPENNPAPGLGNLLIPVDDAEGGGSEVLDRYNPTGNFNTDVSHYWSIAQGGWAQLDNLQQSGTDPLFIDEANGIAFRLGEPGYDGKPAQIIDADATKILQKTLNAESQIERLYGLKQAGLLDAGGDAAAAFLQSEKEKAAEATRKYEDFTTRVSDMIALEDIPNQRMANLASVLKAVNEANTSSESKYASQLIPKNSGGPQFSDTSQFADAIRGTIPDQAPGPYNIDPAALEAPSLETTGINLNLPPPPVMPMDESGGGTITPAAPTITPVTPLPIGPGGGGGFTPVPEGPRRPPVEPLPVPAPRRSSSW